MINIKTVSQCISSDYCKGWNDAVKAIGRCGECKHWGGIDEYGDGFCYNPDGIDNIAKSEDFCSYFEPKE